MNPDAADLQIAELLSAVGNVNPPSSAVVQSARELLWTAVAEEMLSTSDPRTGPAGYKAEHPRRTAPPRRPDSPRQSQQGRNANPGA